MDASQSATAADQGRRVFLKKSLVVSAAAAALGNLPGLAQAEPLSQRYPDPLINILDPSFMDLRIFNASVEKLATGLRWAEGPVWVGDGRYLLVSDIPNNRIVRWDEITGSLSVYRENSNFSNGMCRDRQGRLLVCEGSTTASEGRRITRTEHNGTITVLADSFEGKPLNSPNDIVCKRDGSVWFTDPPFQTGNNYEGHKVTPAQPHAVYRIDGGTGKVSRVIDDLAGPNGLCFSPDEKILYVVEGRAKPNRLIWAITVKDDGTRGSGASTSKAWITRRSMESSATRAATSGAVGAAMATPRPTWKNSTVCECSTLKAKPSGTSPCRSAAPTSASEGGKAIGCSWPAAIRCIRCS